MTTTRAARGVLAVLAVGGCAALIYEIVWLQLLELVVGASGASIGVLLAMFMGGLCLGSLLFTRVVPPRRHPLRVLAAIELAIGALGLAMLVSMPALTGVYVSAGGGSLALRMLLAAVCLLPPTVLMGATLPAAARWVEALAATGSWIGWLYASNVAGAVAGTIAAGFYLLRVYDMAVATYVAAALNAIAAVAAATLARRHPWATPDLSSFRAAASAPGSRASAVLVDVVIAASGATALGCEVIWTRLLSLTFGATVYAFSLILAAFLIGISAGSQGAALLARRLRAPAFALGVCQLGLCATMAWAAYGLASVLPYWPIADAVRTDIWRTFELDFFRALIVVLPSAALWGASVPLAVAAARRPGADPARAVGRVYAANTAGAIVGSLATALLLVAAVGSRRTEQIMIGIAAGAAIASMAAASLGQPRRRVAASVAAAIAAPALVLTVPEIPGVLVAYGRRASEWTGLTTIVHVAEGPSTFVAVSRGSDGTLNYHAAGKVQASAQAEDMRLQRLLGHLSHLIAAHPSNVLVIGCGAGITAGAVAIGAGVDRVTIAEIEPAAVQVAATLFAGYNDGVIANPKVTVRLDDGRHVLMTSKEKFDVITTDMVDPWVRGIATLFTREFFEAAKRHLNPGGVVTQFVQLYQSSSDAVKTEIATFVDVFPNTIVWANTNNGQGYDLVLLGQAEPIRIDVDALQARLDAPPSADVARSLREIGIGSAVALLSTFAATGADLQPWLSGAVLNRDRNLRLQYLAGLGFNLDESGQIYLEMQQYRSFPDREFRGTPASIEALHRAIERANQR